MITENWIYPVDMKIYRNNIEIVCMFVKESETIT